MSSNRDHNTQIIYISIYQYIKNSVPVQYSVYILAEKSSPIPARYRIHYGNEPLVPRRVKKGQNMPVQKAVSMCMKGGLRHLFSTRERWVQVRFCDNGKTRHLYRQHSTSFPLTMNVLSVCAMRLQCFKCRLNSNFNMVSCINGEARLQGRTTNSVILFPDYERGYCGP